MTAICPSKAIYQAEENEMIVEFREDLQNTDVILKDEDARDEAAFILRRTETSTSTGTRFRDNPETKEKTITLDQINSILLDLHLPKSEQWFTVKELDEDVGYILHSKFNPSMLPSRNRSFSTELLSNTDPTEPIIFQTKNTCMMCGEEHTDIWGITIKQPSYTQLFLCSEDLLGILASCNYLILENQKTAITELL